LRQQSRTPLARRPSGGSAVGAGWRPWLALVLLALAGCGTSAPETPEPQPAPCPTALILEGAERTAAYRAGATPRAAEIRYIAVLRDLNSACRYYSGEGGAGVDVDLTFNLIAERGPAMSGSEPLTYFVATIGPDGKILDKELLQGDLTFAEGEERAGWSEDLTLRLPTVSSSEGAGYRLYVGFQLDDAELTRRQEPLLR
jgi:hypothetical protein